MLMFMIRLNKRSVPIVTHRSVGTPNTILALFGMLFGESYTEIELGINLYFALSKVAGSVINEVMKK